ncbi:MAG: tRNA (guanosine(37)-N1)-methyltransferase TrmD [Ignavibacteriales bacterium]|nr:tRNA (guanosine(37)-N1)-methyltransferase TrmD [Ignavibacteriales bacterium]
MRIDIISAVPELLESPLNASIVKRAQTKGKVEIRTHNLRDYAYDKHRMIDDRPFGGGAGMALKPEPFFHCIEKLIDERDYRHIIFTTPMGKIFEQSDAKRFSLAENLMIIAGHYKGIDERVKDAFATDDLSIGNFVLSGGELPALIVADAIVRLVPGVLNDSESALDDSFMDGEYIAAPVYTRPAEFRGMRAPDVLLAGDHGKVEEWRRERSEELTKKWKERNNSSEQRYG